MCAVTQVVIARFTDDWVRTLSSLVQVYQNVQWHPAFLRTLGLCWNLPLYMVSHSTLLCRRVSRESTAYVCSKISIIMTDSASCRSDYVCSGTSALTAIRVLFALFEGCWLSGGAQELTVLYNSMPQCRMHCA